MLATVMRKKIIGLVVFLNSQCISIPFHQDLTQQTVHLTPAFVNDDDDVFHHHHDSNKSDLDRMAERKNEAESIPTQLRLLFARNLRERGIIDFEENTQKDTNDKKSPKETSLLTPPLTNELSKKKSTSLKNHLQSMLQKELSKVLKENTDKQTGKQPLKRNRHGHWPSLTQIKQATKETIKQNTNKQI